MADQPFKIVGIAVLPEPELLVGAAIGKFDDAGNVIDPELRVQVVEMVTALRDWAARIRMPEAQVA
jgi:hypothetical protein